MVITERTSVAEVVQKFPNTRRIFDEHGLHGCGGGQGPAESLAFFASVHQADLSSLVEDLLITIGNSGRVVLQIGTDFFPNVAYPLVRLTGFLEVTALAWWGIGSTSTPHPGKPQLSTTFNQVHRNFRRL